MTELIEFDLPVSSEKIIKVIGVGDIEYTFI
jgi:hypothetical protein